MTSEAPPSMQHKIHLTQKVNIYELVMLDTGIPQSSTLDFTI